MPIKMFLLQGDDIFFLFYNIYNKVRCSTTYTNRLFNTGRKKRCITQQWESAEAVKHFQL